MAITVLLCWVLLSCLVSQLPTSSNPFKPALSGLAFSTRHSGSCHGLRALGKVSGLLQNTLELYLTPGSRPTQKYIGWNLQPSSNQPGGWRKKAAWITDQILCPRPPSFWPPLFICTILIDYAVSSYEVVLKNLGLIWILDLQRRKKKRTIPPNLSQVSCIAFLFSSPQCCSVAAFLKARTIPRCGGAVWNAPENAHDNGSRGGHARLGSGQLWRERCSAWESPAQSRVSLPPCPAPLGDSHREPNRSQAKQVPLKRPLFKIKGIPGAPHPKHAFELAS